MSRSGKVSRSFELLLVFGAAEKIQTKVSELLRKFEANCSRLLSRVLWFSVSRNVLICQENENSNVEIFFPELDKNPPTSS